VDADEVTYPAHILLRFDIERALIEGEAEVEDIPALWDAGMAELLGIDTRGNYKDGPMQDVHWPAGLFGYFPCYTLGRCTRRSGSRMRAMPDAGRAHRARRAGGVFDWLHPRLAGGQPLRDAGAGAARQRRAAEPGPLQGPPAPAATWAGQALATKGAAQCGAAPNCFESILEPPRLPAPGHVHARRPGWPPGWPPGAGGGVPEFCAFQAPPHPRGCRAAWPHSSSASRSRISTAKKPRPAITST
jgi:hypothetical protein